MVASHACAPERSVRRLSLPDEAAWPLANVAFVAFDAEAYSVPPPAPTPADADADAPIDDLIVLCVNALRVMARLPLRLREERTRNFLVRAVRVGDG